jgi:phosphoribosylformimino-5-aminoimidazole carboxamide ribotide isomerase
MIVIPAIDLKGGRCVRLVQGDLARETVYGEDPVAMARRWEGEGAARLHLVDLDGAVAGKPAHLAELRAIASALSIPVQFGGGVRTRDDARAVFEAGAERLILGTVALDARDGRVATRGWTETSGVEAVAAARECRRHGATGVLFTDIARDGTGHGVNVAATVALAEAANLPVIASGGVASTSDVRALRAVAEHGIEAVIIGRALYTGAVKLGDAIAIAAGRKP